ncbi:hypothetical protein WMY93_010391 [Mugilogobius chulae]|uniref:Uncharacterized protein n=1 Tax=Mugilogobius chulae TaxID=88201 RepID=A0AAW0PAV9_9GOBI
MSLDPGLDFCETGLNGQSSKTCLKGIRGSGVDWCSLHTIRQKSPEVYIHLLIHTTTSLQTACKVKGEVSEECGGRDCSTCICTPAKGAQVRANHSAERAEQPITQQEEKERQSPHRKRERGEAKIIVVFKMNESTCGGHSSFVCGDPVVQWSAGRPSLTAVIPCSPALVLLKSWMSPALVPG